MGEAWERLVVKEEGCVMADPAEKMAERIQHAIDSMKGKLTERPMPNADRCILCGWARVDTERGGSCGRDKNSQHLWFTDVLKTIHAERDEARGKFSDTQFTLEEARIRITTLEAGLRKYGKHPFGSHTTWGCPAGCLEKECRASHYCVCGLTDLIENKAT